MLIVVAGMIGGGKSSLTKLISENFGGIAFYEEANSPILQKFYTATEDEANAKRYPFLLQLEFLNSRFRMIKKCLLEGDNPKINILDRSIYEDAYFMEVNHRLGRISDEEATIYLNLLENMLEEIDELPKKAPDLCIYLKGSFDTFIKRIEKRNRGFEVVDPATKEYFYELWQGYDDWINSQYNASKVVVIDIDKLDFVENETDKEILISELNNVFNDLGLLEA